MQKIGLAFLIGWSLFIALVIGREEPPLYLSILLYSIPFTQVTVFSLYRTNQTKQKFGLAFGIALTVFLALFLLRVPTGAFAMFLAAFFVTSFMSAVLHAFYGYGRESALTAPRR